MSLSQRQIASLSQIRVELTQECPVPFALNGQLAPYLLILHDVCNALELSASDKQLVLGEAGMAFVARWLAQPITIATAPASARPRPAPRNGGPS